MRNAEQAGKAAQSHPKATYGPLACDKHATSMREACGIRSCIARVPLVFSSYSPHVLPLFSLGGPGGASGHPLRPTLVWTTLVQPVFKGNRSFPLGRWGKDLV